MQVVQMLNECMTQIIVINVKVYNTGLRNISGIQPYYQKLLFIVFDITFNTLDFGIISERFNKN